MDKYEYSIKADKIKKLVDRKDYATAVKIADTIDWERVKNVKMLSTVSLAYEKLERYEDAKEVLLMAYESSPVGRRFLYRLTELAIKEGKLEEAESYLKEFAATSPKDPSRLILRYEIAEARQEPLERLITILEAYQKREFEERWSYELAVLYYRAGKTEECVKLCDEIVLWFGVGPYVDKALELKQEIQPLTPEQLERKEHKEKYLRQWENIQKEFEEKEQSLVQERPKNWDKVKKTATEPEEETGKEAEKETAAGDRQLPEQRSRQIRRAAMERAGEKVRDSRKVVKLPRQEEADSAGAEHGEAPVRSAGMTGQEAALQQEMEASLAKEIETAAMTATLNEMMLRETAATMEEVGAVNNDHSDTKERTKVAAERYTEQTREFAREAFVINEVLKEVTGQAVSPEVIEEKLRSLTIQEAMQEAWGESAAAEQKPAEAVTADEVRQQSAPEASGEEETTEGGASQGPVHTAEIPQAETGKEEAGVRLSPDQGEALATEESSVSAPEKERVQEEELQEDSAAGEPVEDNVQEEPAVGEPAGENVQEASAVGEPAEENVQEAPAVGELQHGPAEEEPEKEKNRAEEAAEEATGGAELYEMRQVVRDHYVLIAAAEEESGLQRSVAYIRDTRLRLQKPVTQIAKITGKKLAAKEIVKTMRKLQGRDLVISGIADLPDDILLETIRWMAEDQVESFIVLLDSREELEQLIARKPYFAGCVYLSEDVQAEAGNETEAKAGGKTGKESEENPEEKTESGPERSLEGKPERESEESPESEQKMEVKGREEENLTLAQLVEAALQSGGLDAYAAPPQKTGRAVQDDAPLSEAGMQPKQFVETAIQYARMLDTIIDEMGELALFALAEDYVQEREPLTEELAQEVVEKAILRAEKRSLKNLLSNRYDKDGYLILKEKHFKED